MINILANATVITIALLVVYTIKVSHVVSGNLVATLSALQSVIPFLMVLFSLA